MIKNIYFLTEFMESQAPDRLSFTLFFFQLIQRFLNVALNVQNIIVMLQYTGWYAQPLMLLVLMLLVLMLLVLVLLVLIRLVLMG